MHQSRVNSLLKSVKKIGCCTCASPLYETSFACLSLNFTAEIKYKRETMNTLLNKVQYLYGISVVDVLQWCNVMLLT